MQVITQAVCVLPRHLKDSKIIITIIIRWLSQGDGETCSWERVTASCVGTVHQWSLKPGGGTHEACGGDGMSLYQDMLLSFFRCTNWSQGVFDILIYFIYQKEQSMHDSLIWSWKWPMVLALVTTWGLLTRNTLPLITEFSCFGCVSYMFCCLGFLIIFPVGS